MALAARTVGIDRLGIPASVIGSVGNDITVKIWLLDLISGPVTGVGATIVAAVGGNAMTVDYSTVGLYVCTLSDSQTTTLGTGSWTWKFKHTPAGGDTQDYVTGRFILTETASQAGSSGIQYGEVNGVMVVVL